MICTAMHFLQFPFSSQTTLFCWKQKRLNLCSISNMCFVLPASCSLTSQYWRAVWISTNMITWKVINIFWYFIFVESKMFTDLSILTSGVNIYKHENSISGEQRDLTTIVHLEYVQAVSITVGIQNTDSNCSYHLEYMYAVLITVIAQNTGNRIWSDFVDHLKNI